MDVRIPVRIGNLLVVNLAQPVVGGNGAGVGQDQTADRIGHGGILLDAPVIDLEVVVHNLLVVQQRIAHIAHTLTLLTIQDICLGDLVIARLNQDRLHAVLNILHRHPILLDLGLEIGRDLQRQKVDGVIIILQITGIKRLNDCIAYLAQVEIDNLAVPFDYCIHTALLCYFVPAYVLRPAVHRRARRSYTIPYLSWFVKPIFTIFCAKFQKVIKILCQPGFLLRQRRAFTRRATRSEFPCHTRFYTSPPAFAAYAPYTFRHPQGFRCP